MLDKLNRVLSLFSSKQPELAVLDIAKALRWPKSTTYRLLSTIEKQGFLDRDEVSGLFRLGIHLATLGDLARHSTSLQRLAMPVLRQLSTETGETATLMVLVGSEGITIDVAESHRPLMLPGLLGGRMPLHATAGGKAFLAWSSPRQLQALLHPPLARFTPTTITSVDDLMKELAASRRRGYTIVNGEHVEDVVGVAAPIRDHRGSIPGVLTLGRPRSRASVKLEMLGQEVMKAADTVSRSLGHRPDASVDNAESLVDLPLPVRQVRPIAKNGRRASGGPRRTHG